MAKKRRIAAKDLQSIRENFRAEKLNSDVEQPNINKQKSKNLIYCILCKFTNAKNNRC